MSAAEWPSPPTGFEAARVANGVAAAIVPILWSATVPARAHLGPLGRTAANAAVAYAYATTFNGTPRWLSGRGFRLGIRAAMITLVGYLVVASVPPLRRALTSRAAPMSRSEFARWVLIHIPIGTVYSEELIFRGTLEPLLVDTFGRRTGILLGAFLFGLWHVPAARAGGENVAAALAVTTLGGMVFGRLGRRGGNVTAPALLHLALNVGGAFLVGRGTRGAIHPHVQDTA